MLFRPPTRAALTLAAAVVLLPLATHAQTSVSPSGAGAERESLESLRQTTLALIEALVQGGTLSREKADALLADARRRAQAAASTAASAGTWGDAPRAGENAPVVRVPYVPQIVRDQIRNELREEIVAKARIERWGVPNTTAEWTDRIAIEGDLRVRAQGDRPDANNPTPLFLSLAADSGTTRAPDLAAANAAGLPTGNTLDERERLRLRARLGINVKVNDTVTAGIRLATGSATDRVSTNQTLGQNFNRYAFLVDRAFVRYDPVAWASVQAGRIANPWFSTDLVWSDNLNFEGIAGSLKWPWQSANAQWQPFATVGYFPVRESSPPKRGRSMAGWQLGVQWEASQRTRVKLAIAQYSYVGFEGRIDPDYDIDGPGRSYGQYEYEAGLRQRGNSLFLTNNPLEYDPRTGLPRDKFRWGMGMRFKPLAVTAAAEFSHFAPYVVGLSAEVVHNQAFSLEEAHARTGFWFNDARAFGVGLRATVGAQQVRNGGDWQVTAGYRWLGSDAVPDAFVDSDLAGGGTNLRGVMLGASYGLARDTNLGLRYLSGRTISAPSVLFQGKDRFANDSLQVDLNVRF